MERMSEQIVGHLLPPRRREMIVWMTGSAAVLQKARGWLEEEEKRKGQEPEALAKCCPW